MKRTDLNESIKNQKFNMQIFKAYKKNFKPNSIKIDGSVPACTLLVLFRFQKGNLQINLIAEMCLAFLLLHFRFVIVELTIQNNN